MVKIRNFVCFANFGETIFRLPENALFFCAAILWSRATRKRGFVGLPRDFQKQIGNFRGKSCFVRRSCFFAFLFCLRLRPFGLFCFCNFASKHFAFFASVFEMLYVRVAPLSHLFCVCFAFFAFRVRASRRLEFWKMET